MCVSVEVSLCLICHRPHLGADAGAVAHARRVHGVGTHRRADDGEGRRQAIHGRTQRADGGVEGTGGPHGCRAE